MDSYQCPYDTGLARSPVIPLPNPGEGGSVDTGTGSGGLPVIPLPNPGEGGSVNSGSGGVPVIPLPNPGEGGPVDSGSGGTPVIPLPNPGEGGPVAPGPIYPSRPGQTIVVLPNLRPPCYFCPTGTRVASVRFLNAAHGYAPFTIYINGRMAASSLSFASISAYGRVADGFQTVTVAGPDGYIYVQKSMPFRAAELSTIAVIRTPSGLDLLQISDTPCTRPAGMSCIRACNLAYNSLPLDVILYDGRVVFSDVTYKEVTSFKRIRPGDYDFYIAQTNLTPMPRDMDIETVSDSGARLVLPSALVSFYVKVQRNSMYTIYIMNYENDATAIRTMIVEDRMS